MTRVARGMVKSVDDAGEVTKRFDAGTQRSTRAAAPSCPNATRKLPDGVKGCFLKVCYASVSELCNKPIAAGDRIRALHLRAAGLAALHLAAATSR